MVGMRNVTDVCYKQGLSLVPTVFCIDILKELRVY